MERSKYILRRILFAGSTLISAAACTLTTNKQGQGQIETLTPNYEGTITQQAINNQNLVDTITAQAITPTATPTLPVTETPNYQGTIDANAITGTALANLINPTSTASAAEPQLPIPSFSKTQTTSSEGASNNFVDFAENNEAASAELVMEMEQVEFDNNQDFSITGDSFETSLTNPDNLVPLASHPQEEDGLNFSGESIKHRFNITDVLRNNYTINQLLVQDPEGYTLNITGEIDDKDAMALVTATAIVASTNIDAYGNLTPEQIWSNPNLEVQVDYWDDEIYGETQENFISTSQEEMDSRNATLGGNGNDASALIPDQFQKPDQINFCLVYRGIAPTRTRELQRIDDAAYRVDGGQSSTNGVMVSAGLTMVLRIPTNPTAGQRIDTDTFAEPLGLSGWDPNQLPSWLDTADNSVQVHETLPCGTGTPATATPVPAEVPQFVPQLENTSVPGQPTTPPEQPTSPPNATNTPSQPTAPVPSPIPTNNEIFPTLTPHS